MCEDCVQNKVELAEFAKQQIRQMYAEPSKGVTSEVQMAVLALEYAVEHPEQVDITEEKVEKLREVLVQLKAMDQEQEVPVELTQVISELLAGPSINDRVKVRSSPLGQPTQDTIATDQEKFPGENLGDRLIRGFQHWNYYHEGRSQYFYQIIDEETLLGMADRMRHYAKQAMRTMPAFDHSIMVLQEEIAADALENLLMTVLMEGMMSGYYAGSQGMDCGLWQTHILGPVGRMDQRDDDVKIAEVMEVLRNHNADKE